MDSTLLKGLAVLEKLGRAEQALGVSALAAEFQVPKSNMHRTLSTLVEAGFVAKNSNGNYFATLKAWEIGLPAVNRHPVLRAALGFMQILFQEAQETVNLIVLDGEESLYIHQVCSAAPIRLSNTIGERAPAIMTVSGRAMLAFLPDAPKRLKELYGKQAAPKLPPKLNELLQEADSIRDAGYAKAASVWRPCINSMASVIFGPNRQPLAAVAVAGPRERFTQEKMDSLAPALLNTCNNISRALGM